jgi:hypothetical protein
MTETRPHSRQQLNNLEQAIASLRERVAKLNWNNGILFWMTGLVIVAGFSLVAAAGNLATLETVDYVGEAVALRTRLLGAEQALDRVNAKLGEKERTLPVISAALQTLAGETGDMRDVLRRLPEALSASEAARATDRQRVMVASIVIRLTAGLLLGYLIQVLLNVYRYNARLIAFYEARADALLLAGELDAAVLEKTAKLLFPDKLELDKAPDAPAKQVVEMLKQLTTLSRAPQPPLPESRAPHNAGGKPDGATSH